MAKITSRKLDFRSKRVDSVYTGHANSLFEAGLVPSTILTIEEICKYRDEKIDCDKKKDPTADRNKNRNINFCVAYSRYFSVSIHRVIHGIKNHIISHG